MGEYGHEIPEEVSKSRLLYLWANGGICPMCKRLVVTPYDNDSVVDFNTKEKIYVCDKCGVIARQSIKKWSLMEDEVTHDITR